ncbi:hypothetical protein RYX36_020762 [Vicia faba]
MDSRVVQSKVVENKDEQNLDSQQVVTHDAEEHTEPEKKSVMSRVKARARKIKNSITGHSQQTPDQTSGHDSEIQHNPEEDEDDDDVGDLDESKENVQEPLGHQAPNYGGREGKNATATTESGKVENLRNLVFDLEGSKDVGEEPYHDPLTEGVSSTTETNQNIATDKAKPFALEEKPDQFKADFEGPIVSKEDSQEQGSRTDAYDIPKYQTRDTDPNVEVYDSEDVKSATPKFESEPVENLGKSGIDFEGAKVVGEEPRRDSLDDDVSSTTTESNQNIAKPFTVDDKPDQFKANLARLGFSKEDFEEQVSRTEAYNLPKHQTNDTYPSEDVKSATSPPEYKQGENFGSSGIGFEGEKVKGEEPRGDSLFEGDSATTTETNQNIAKPFVVEDNKPEQFKANLERPGFSEDFEEQGRGIEAYTLPKHQTNDTYPSEDVKSATSPPEYKQLENFGSSGIGFEGEKVKGEEPRGDSLFEGDSATTTETNQNIAKPFAVEDNKPEQFKANLERPGFSEDFEEQGRGIEAYTLPKHQTNDTYPSEDVKSATSPPEYKQLENFGSSGIGFEGEKVKGEEPRGDSLFEGDSATTTETNQSIAKPFAVEDNKPEQFKANLERPGFSEDFEEQGRGIEAYTLPKHQTSDTYPSEDVKSATSPPEYKQVEDFGNSEVGFEDAKVKGEEPRRDTLFEGVSETTTETNQNIAKPFSVEDKPDQFKANSESQGFSEDFEKQGSRIEANTLPKYQTSDTYPSEEGELRDVKPLEESLGKLNVHDDESKPVADTEYPPSAGSHDQFVPHFSDATKTKNEYPQETISADINRNHDFSEEDSQDQESRTEAYTIPGYQTRDTDPSGVGSDEVKDFTPLEESLERLNVHDDDEPKPIRELKIEPSVADTEYPASAGSHDIRQPVPHFFDASKSHNEFSQETVSKGINKNHENPSETEETFNTVTNTAENQPGYEESVETQPKHNKSYADENEFASATTADKTLTREDDEAFKPSNDGTSTGSNTNDGTETDKGAAVRDYFNEKSRPGEEDKALAEVITEALHKGKDEPLKSVDGKFDSEVEKPEKVFVEESNVASPGKGVVDRVTGYVGSWFAKSEENPSPQGAGIGTEDLSKNKDSVVEGKHDGKVVGEGRIQE